LVKLLIEEDGSELAGRSVLEAEAMASSALTFVEAHSALARARRDDRISLAQQRSSLDICRALWSRAAVIPPDNRILERAAQHASDHALRAYDAVQLASAMTAATRADTTLICWDKDLRSAAAAEGLALLPE
jgi:hypothetical protein